MSINSAMMAGVSGLGANASALAAISDNIANVNTVAYKRNQVNFATQVTAQVAGKYSAGGVQGTTHQFVSQQGLIQNASSPTSLAISGDGFFVTTQKATDVTPGDARLFTRSGSFAVDAQGFLVNDGGLYLQGWQAKADGTFEPNPSDLSKLASVNVRDLGAAVQATGKAEVSANLDKEGAISGAEASYSSALAVAPALPKSMADYAADPTTGTKPDFTVEMNVLDSVGGSHKVAMAFLKSAANPNEWHAEIYALPVADITVAASKPGGQLAAGLVKFDQTGAIDLSTSTLFGAAGAPARLTLADSGTATTPRWTDSVGVAGQTIDLDLSRFTQYASPSTVNSVNSDGAAVGNIVGVQVDETGVVSAIFDNSQIRKVAKIALATFPNADGLKAVSGNAYRASLDAGQMVIKEPGVGAGQISPSSLEASTVDLSAEFTGLITTQKAYSASSKIITTADQMLEQLLQIVR